MEEERTATLRGIDVTGRLSVAGPDRLLGLHDLEPVGVGVTSIAGRRARHVAVEHIEDEIGGGCRTLYRAQWQALKQGLDDGHHLGGSQGELEREAVAGKACAKRRFRPRADPNNETWPLRYRGAVFHLQTERLA